MSSTPNTPVSAREIVEASPIPLFDGPSKQAAALMLESCGLSIQNCSHGFRIRRGKRGWTAKGWEPTLKGAIDAYRVEGPKRVLLECQFHLQIASALAGTQDEKPYRALVACYSDAVDMLEKLELEWLHEGVSLLDGVLDGVLDEPSRTDSPNKVIQFPTRGTP